MRTVRLALSFAAFWLVVLLLATACGTDTLLPCVQGTFTPGKPLSAPSGSMQAAPGRSNIARQTLPVNCSTPAGPTGTQMPVSTFVGTPGFSP